jgi:microcystin degradation protein MlrC
MERASIVVGGVSHETNTFLPERTTREDFQRTAEYFGEAVLEGLEGTNTVVGGVIDAAREEDVDLRPTVSAGATPGGTVTAETYEFYVEELTERIDAVAEEADGVLLALHGAMVPEGLEDGEGPLVSAVRDVVGSATPIVVTLDLHGNVSDELVDAADALVAFETYPHVDTAETGRRGLSILLEIVRGDLDPVQHVERPPVVVAGPPQQTMGDTPVAALMDRARALERRPGVAKVNLFTGFHQADVPFLGPSVPVVGSDEAAVRDAARDLATALWDAREQLVVESPSPSDAVAEARRLVENGATADGPVVLADLGDNPGAGGTADTTHVLRELIDQGVENAGFALIRDAEAVATCIEAGVGERVPVAIGGKIHESSGTPIETEASVSAITDGTYERTGPMRTGTTVRSGRTVLVEVGPTDGISVVLTEERSQPLDAELWRHVGVRPAWFDVVVVKSTNHFRAAYEPIASEIRSINSPGLSAEDPEFYDYEHLDRALYPLGSEEAIDYPPWN